jgi:hypothetical protein
LSVLSNASNWERYHLFGEVAGFIELSYACTG